MKSEAATRLKIDKFSDGRRGGPKVTEADRLCGGETSISQRLAAALGSTRF